MNQHDRLRGFASRKLKARANFVTFPLLLLDRLLTQTKIPPRREGMSESE